MGVTVWIVVAFGLGVLFGRLTARSSAAHAGGPTGVGASAGAGPGSGLRFGQGAPARVTGGDPNGIYRVTLLDRGPNIINTIKAVRAVTRLGLKDAKDTVEGAPVEIVRVNSADQAQAILRAFQGVATVRLDGPADGTSSFGPGYTPGAGPQRSS